MENKRKTLSNEASFKSFIAQYEPVEDLDEIEAKFPDSTKIADYAEMVKEHFLHHYRGL